MRAVAIYTCLILALLALKPAAADTPMGDFEKIHAYALQQKGSCFFSNVLREVCADGTVVNVTDLQLAEAAEGGGCFARQIQHVFTINEDKDVVAFQFLDCEGDVQAGVEILEKMSPSQILKDVARYLEQQIKTPPPRRASARQAAFVFI